MAQYNNPSLPSNLYSAGAVRVDNRQLNQMLYQHQQQEQLRREKEGAALQEEFANNVAKMRDADVEEYSSLYSKEKEMKKALLFDKKLQRDPQAYLDAQMRTAKVAAARNKMFATSKRELELENMLPADYIKNGDHYRDDFTPRMALRRATPVSKLGAVQVGFDATGKPIIEDLSTADAFLDKTLYHDFSTDLKDARGSATLTGYSDRKNLNNSGSQYEITSYKAYNSPALIATNLQNKWASSKNGLKSATLFGKNITDDAYNQVLEQYKNADPKKWEMMGKKPEELSLLHPDNAVEKAANFMAMKDFLESKLEIGGQKIINDADVKRKLDEAHDVKMESLRHLNNEKEIKLRKNLDGKSADAQQRGIDAYMSGLEKSEGKIHHLDFLDGKKLLAKEIPASASFLKSFERLDKFGRKLQPTAVYYENGHYYPIFPELKLDKDGDYTGEYKLDANGNTIIDKTLSKPVRRQDVKVNYSNAILPPKMVAETLEEGEVPGRGAPKAPKAPSAPDEDDDLINSYIPTN